MESIVFDLINSSSTNNNDSKNINKINSYKNNDNDTTINDTSINDKNINTYIIEISENDKNKINSSKKNKEYIQYSYTSKKPIKVVENIYYLN